MSRKPIPAELDRRCDWCTSDPLYITYHDEEWGVPEKDERALFERLVLEGMQAGLSWLTILKKRAHYRKLFDKFDPELVARYDRRKIERLLKDPGIVRNRAKVESAVGNAKAFLEIRAEFGTFGRFCWGFVDGEPKINRWRTTRQLPAKTKQSEALSRELLARGMRFVGPTICYAFMQSVGMVNDHTTDCFRYRELCNR